MPDVQRSALNAIVTNVLKDLGGDISQSVRSLGLEVRVGTISAARAETLGPKATRAQKPVFQRLARDLRNEPSLASALRSFGEVEADLHQHDMPERSFPPVRYFYALEDELAWTTDQVPWRCSLKGWAFTASRSSTPFSPQLLRGRFDRLRSAVLSTFAPPSRATFLTAIRGGALTEALSVLSSIFDLSGFALWIYDESDRRYRSLAAVGTGKQPFNVPARRTNSAKRVGIVSQIRPNRRPVVYDSKDPTLWQPPEDGDWTPFDDDLFQARKWRSCIAIPIACAGRVVGALSAYSPESARQFEAIETDLASCAALCADAVFVRRETEVIGRLESRYEEELLTANVSLSALSLSHDVLHYYKTVEQAVTEAQGYLQTDQSEMAREKMNEATAMIRRTEPALEAMRKLANEAREPRSDRGPQETPEPDVVLDELKPLLQSILPHFSSADELQEDCVYVEVEGTPRPVAVTPLSLERIVVNLCVNAAQWHAQHVWVTAYFDRSTDELHLVVRDDGQGIEPAARDLVFDRFFSERDGSGLGLYVVKNLVTRADGEVHLQSYDGSDNVGKPGTVVTVVIPTL
jgi:signal transduction histidine kinase